jgi:hypothetical protein
MSSISTQNTLTPEYKFICDKCDFKCCKKGDFTRHILTLKHINNYNSTENKVETVKLFICKKCDKEYNSRVGLWHHKKKCIIIENKQEEKETNEQIIQFFIKENAEFKKQILEIVKNINPNNNNSLNI